MEKKSTLAVEAHGITKTYGNGSLAVQALKGIDLSVENGEFMMLAGHSGSGKTTLLSILGCVLRASSGTLKLFGEEISNLSESASPELRLSYVGFIFQGHNLIASLSNTDNIALVMQLRGHPIAEARKEAHRLLELVGLSDKKNFKPRELSGGQRQRVAIARALAGAPPLILADEPTAALDATTGLSITELLKQLAHHEKRTVIVVTHDNRIFHLADRIVQMEDGQIKEKVA